jgi:hypothetical protein
MMNIITKMLGFAILDASLLSVPMPASVGASVARADDLSQAARLGNQLFLFSVCGHPFSQIAASNTGETQALLKSYEQRMNDATMHSATALGLTYEQFGRTVHGGAWRLPKGSGRHGIRRTLLPFNEVSKPRFPAGDLTALQHGPKSSAA